MKEMLGLLYKSGIRIVPGTDAETGFAYHRELELYAEAGIPPLEVLHMATLGSAQLMKREGELGSVTPGKLADLVLVEGDPSANMSDIRRTALVIKDGVLLSPGALHAAVGVSPAADRRQAETLTGFQTQTMTANGVSLAYVDEGSGPPVVLVHGSTFDYRGWLKQIAALSRHYRVIAYSRRYHPPNPPPGQDADASVARQADDLAALIRELGIAPAHIVGQSYGGTIAVGLALKHPALVRSLVLAEPGLGMIIPASPENRAQTSEREAVQAERRQAFATGNAERILETYAERVAPGVLETLPPDIRAMLLANVPALQLDSTAPRPPLTCNDLARIEVPVLVLAGNRSPAGLQRIAEAAAKCIKHAQLVTLEDATHWMHLDQTEAFNREVLGFLGASESARLGGRERTEPR